MKQRDIVFEDDVKIISGKKTLKTDKIYFSPKEAVLYNDSPFILETDRGKMEGEKLTSDIFLRILDSGTRLE